MSGSANKPRQGQPRAAAAKAKPGARQSAKLVPLRPRRKCPICGKKASQSAYPFCSVRCADIDLDRWLFGRYRVAGSADDEDAPPDQTSPANGALDTD
jgi:endogenous inhibitor of DNA gyrase (YacG/DUF329 family)